MWPVRGSKSWCHISAVTLLFVVVITILQSVAASQDDHSDRNSDDPHGGVPMGRPNKFCDDGKTNLEIDWDPSSTDEYTCLDERTEKAKEGLHYYHCDEQAKRPVHVCYPEKIIYDEDMPTSGRHRPLWPKYGEYTYLPIQRWLHSLEHGAVVFLYHPCADHKQIEIFKGIARSCLRRHIISPFKKFPPDMNFALLTWQCKYLMSDVQVARMVQFIKARAFHSRESSTYQNGQYSLELIHPAELVSDIKDSELCPQMSVMDGTSEKIKTKSLARQTHSKQAQIRLASIMSKFMAGYP